MSDADGIPALIEQPAPRSTLQRLGSRTVRPERLYDVLDRALDQWLILYCAACATIHDALDRQGVEAFLRQALSMICFNLSEN